MDSRASWSSGTHALQGWDQDEQGWEANLGRDLHALQLSYHWWAPLVLLTMQWKNCSRQLVLLEGCSSAEFFKGNPCAEKGGSTQSVVFCKVALSLPSLLLWLCKPGAITPADTGLKQVSRLMTGVRQAWPHQIPLPLLVVRICCWLSTVLTSMFWPALPS